MIRALLLWLLSIPAASAAVEAIPLSQLQGSSDLSPYAQLFEDATGVKKIDEVVAQPLDRFVLLQQHGTALGYSRSRFWLKVALHNDTDRARYWLEVGEPRLQQIALYQFSASNQASLVQQLQGGSVLQRAERPMDAAANLFPVEIPLGETHTLYLSIASKTAITVPLSLWQPEHYLDQHSNRSLFRLLLYGAILGISVLFLLVHPFNRTQDQLYYSLALLGFAIFVLTYNGFIHHLIPAISGDWAIRPMVMGAAGATLFFLAFTRLYLQLQRYSPRWYRIIGWIMGYDLLVFLMGWWGDYLYAGYAISIAAPLAAVAMLGATWVAVRSKVWNAWFYLLANAPFWIVVTLTFFHWEGGKLVHVLPQDRPLLSIGISGVLFLSISFAIRFDRLQREKVATQKQLLETEMKMAAQHKEQEMERQQRKQQSAFMAMLTHELRTPLSIIKVALGAESPSDNMRRQADRAISDMNDVIEQCALAERIDAGELPAASRSFQLDELIAGLQQREHFTERFQWHIQQLLPELESNRELLHVILLNLLNNAERHSEEGSDVVVTAEAAQRGEQEGVEITVSNLPGRSGWPDVNKVFQKYYRSPGAYNLTGSGLGLYLSHTLAEKLGGELRYQPDRDRVRFVLWLPHSVL